MYMIEYFLEWVNVPHFTKVSVPTCFTISELHRRDSMLNTIIVLVAASCKRVKEMDAASNTASTV